MSDYRVFDSFQDAVIVLDAERGVHYGNMAAALLFEVSARRLSTGRALEQFVEFSPDLTETDTPLQSIVDSTKVREIAFTSASGKTGWAQVCLQPQPSCFNAEGGEGQLRWIVTIRDVSLEKTLHDKYRAELDQKQAVIDDLQVARAKLEDYSKNLERMVEDRTRELREANTLLKTILDSLGQGILVFDSEGRCLPVFSQICRRLMGQDPAGKPIEDVLRFSPSEAGSFANWRAAVFASMLDFEDLVPLAPSRLPAEDESLEISLGYNQMKAADGSVAGVVVVATDRTREVQAVREAARERDLVRKVVQAARHKEAFRLFVADTNKLIDELNDMTLAIDGEELARQLHTLKGGSATFALTALAAACHELEDRWKSIDVVSPGFRSERQLAAQRLLAIFNEELAALTELLGPSAGQAVPVIEVPFERMQAWAQRLMHAGSIEESMRIGREILREANEKPVGEAFRHLGPALEELAERLGKKLAPLEIVGGDTRVQAKPLQPLFASFIHAFRNALDHGLEAPDERRLAGKDERGKIVVQFQLLESDERKLEIRICDDGRGVDPERVRAKLKKSGREDLARQPDEDVIQAILLDDVSTAETVTDLSGRGIGMAAIAAEARKLGGEIRVQSELGKGVTLVVRVPLRDGDELKLESGTGKAA